MLSPLQSPRCTAYANLLKVKFKHLVLDESHAWVRGRLGQTRSNQLTCLRDHLLRRSSATWHLSGTVFPGDANFDLPQTIMSLATNEQRQTWAVDLTPKYPTTINEAGQEVLDEREEEVIKQLSTLNYSDEGLLRLRTEWLTILPAVKSRFLVPIMIRRTGESKIDGKALCIDWMSNARYDMNGEISLTTLAPEIQRRTDVIRNSNTQYLAAPNRMLVRRLVAYSSKAIEITKIKSKNKLRAAWESFTLRDASEFERGRRLIKILSELRSRGLKPIIFAAWQLHLQFAARVCISLLPEPNH